MFTLLSTARRKLLAIVMSGEVATCPCCNATQKVYKRRVHSSVARDLIKLYKVGGAEKYVHYSKFRTTAGSGDIAKARFFGLLIHKPKSPLDRVRKASGYWKLSTKGIMFVEGRIAIPEYVKVYQNEVIGSGFWTVFMQECLGDKFNYDELMGF